MPKNPRADRPISQGTPARLGVELSARTDTTIYDYHELLSNRVTGDTKAYLVVSEILEERESWLTELQVQELLKSISRLALPSKPHSASQQGYRTVCFSLRASYQSTYSYTSDTSQTRLCYVPRQLTLRNPPPIVPRGTSSPLLQDPRRFKPPRAPASLSS
jgi:hypothetical protein